MTTETETQTPLEQEQALLGLMIADPTCIRDITGLLRPWHFTDKRCRMIFDAIRDLHNDRKPVSPIAVFRSRKNRHESVRLSLAELAALPFTPEDTDAIVNYSVLIHMRAEGVGEPKENEYLKRAKLAIGLFNDIYGRELDRPDCETVIHSCEIDDGSHGDSHFFTVQNDGIEYEIAVYKNWRGTLEASTVEDLETQG